MQRKTHFIKNVESEAEQPTFLDYLKREGLKVFMGAPLIAKGQLVGVLELFARSPVQVAEDWQDFLDTLANQAAVSIDNLKMFNDLQRTTLDLTLAYDATIEGWSQAMDLRDKETEGHTQRVTELTMLLARRLGLSGEQLVQVRRGALLHDIGKLGVPDSILHKPGSLDPDERREIQKHPNYAYEMLYPIAYLKPALEIPYCHHEKWDGTGYPRGLKGEQIPIEARIFSVVDVWDALTNERPYREAWSQEKTLQYIRDETERFFDPNVVEVFLKVMEEESEDYKKAG
jgi:putative nucleotidyltransferase with HDIG domain